MAIASGSSFGTYEIGESIGAGGMGVVYRATDTKLKRDVAIKVLPESIATDPERLTRFQREAEVLASLNHPNIAQIYGLEDSDGTTALVMELVEGPTLADRIAKGPLPSDEALGIAMQIADALEAAHGQNIVHRDLKPANIKLRPDGTVKVLDFGIAKALDFRGISGGLSPVMTTPAMTETGVILGTAAYMSPEQARGKGVDQRTDIWAFGCVLYEMLTGQPAFGGEDVTVTLARILERGPDLDALPKQLSPSVRTTIALCLEKDPRRRVADVRDIRLALMGRFESIAEQGIAASARTPSRWSQALVAGAALISGGLIVGVAGRVLSPELHPPSVNRFSYELPPGQDFALRPNRSVLSIAKDGRSFVYDTQQGLFLRRLGELEARPIQGSGVIRGLSLSPDGQSIVFFDARLRQLKRVSVDGGAPVVIADAPGVYGLRRSTDGMLLFGGPAGIMRLSPAGGTPEILIPHDGERPWEEQAVPELLPDGDTMLFVVPKGPGDDRWEDPQVVVQSLSTGERAVVVQHGTEAHYLPTGHLVYARGDTLYAQAFDLGRREAIGEAVPVVQGMFYPRRDTGSAHYDVADDGTLAYVQGNYTGPQRTLVWVDRQGREEALPLTEPSSYVMPRLSPDGTRVALDDRNPQGDVWIVDLSNQTRIRLETDDGQGGSYPVWERDGAHIVYSSVRQGLVRQAANGTGNPEMLVDGIDNPYFFTPSGQLVFRNQSASETREDIGITSVEPGAEPVWLLRTRYQERNAELSPDARWVAYQSDESGRFEIYVRPFPDVETNRIPVSNAGGVTPLWSRDGQELFYLELEPRPRLMSVAVDTTGTLTVGSRTAVLDWRWSTPVEGRAYDVSLDGQRFLALKAVDAGSAAPRIIIVQNWFEDLERLVPTE